MATIKSTLALEDKMTPTLSKAEKQAIANIKEYNKLAREVDTLQKAMGDLAAAGQQNTQFFNQLSSASNSLVDKMKQIEQGTLSVAEKNKEASTSYTELNQGLELAAKGYSLVQKAISKVNELVDISNNQYNAQYTAATKMHNMMGANKDEINSLYEYASALQDIGVVGDEALISGMGILSTSTSNTESLKALTKATANAAVGIHGLNTNQSTYESVAGYVQKALEGSAQQLYRNQVLTKKQADYVDSLNDVTEKENALITLLNKNFGDANETLAQTSQGGILQAKNQLSDLQEELGEKLIPIISEFATIAMKIVGPALDFITEHINVIAPAFIVLASAIMLATAAQWALNIAQASNPIGLIIVLIAVLITVLIALWENCEGFRHFLVTWYGNQAKGVVELYNLYAEIHNKITDILGSLVKAAQTAFFNMADAFKNMAISMIRSGNGALGVFKKMITAYNKIAGVAGGATILADFALSEEGITGATEAAKKILGATPFDEKMPLIDTAQFGEFIDSVGQKVENFTIGGLIADKIDEAKNAIAGNTSDLFEDVTIPDTGKGGAGKAIQTTTNDSLLSDEDMQLLLDIATRDYKLTYQQVTPNITLTFGDVRETADVDEILDVVADRLEEIYDSNLEVAPA